MLLPFLIGCVVASVGILLAVNFMSGEKKLDRRIAHTYALEDPRFAHELGALLGPPFLPDNQATILLNGDKIFPSMLGAIEGARNSITFETYIYWSGDIGRRFASALSAAARRGVRTHVLLDWVGSGKMDDALLEEMTAAGVQIKKFHPPHWYALGRLNNRTHRKLLVVDGRVGFTGGVGIAEEWTGNAQSPNHWRDTHVRIEGPVVAQMQAVFMDNWVKVTGEVLHGEPYFPQLAPHGGPRAQMFSSSPTGGSESMQLMYLFSIAAAVRTIDLSAAYFVPDDLTREALLVAMKRGVKLRIIVPGEHMDSETVKHASRALWGPLLEAGAVIAEYQPTMFHCKVLIVDQLLVSMGSTNFDNRSFRLNDEATLNMLDSTFAAEQTAVFEQDLARSKRVSLESWANRPTREKILDWLSGLLRSQL
ncbi:MAG: cardiolipin synthase B [Cytophagales bacterium]|nr:cardiolipin synthase B [Rhizobacter sp.]